jgi:hypothetical protein
VVEFTSPASNLLWRWLGIRAVPHLPCGFECEATDQLSQAILDAGRRLGREREIDDILEVLSWPAEWSGLHGIGEVKTPILKFTTATDFSPAKRTVSYRGESYPEAGAIGLSFPYRPPSKSRSSRSHVPAVAATRNLQQQEVAGDPTQNGFSSFEGMTSAHSAIDAAVSEILNHNHGTILDLGCGDGSLLAQLVRARPNLVPIGIDRRKAAIEAARTHLPNHASNFSVIDIWEYTWPNDVALALISLRRLEEGTSNQLLRFAESSKKRASHILFYEYAESKRPFAREELLAELGWKIVKIVQQSRVRCIFV